MSTKVISNEYYRVFTSNKEDSKMDYDNTIAKSIYKNTIAKSNDNSRLAKLINAIKPKRISKSEKALHAMRLKEVERTQDKAREFYHYNTFNR